MNSEKTNRITPDLTAAALDLISTRVQACYVQAEAFYARPFLRPQVLINLRGRSAGVAELHKNRLRFNRILFAENTTAFLREVVPHEVAHLLAWQLHGRQIKPHGPQWRAIMKDVFGLTARATHSFDTRRSAGRGYIYTCTCPEREHALTLHRHNKIRRGHGYLCRDCKGLLHFLQKEKSLLHKDKSVTQS